MNLIRSLVLAVMQCLAYRVDVAKQLDCVSGYPRLESSYIVTK